MGTESASAIINGYIDVAYAVDPLMDWEFDDLRVLSALITAEIDRRLVLEKQMWGTE